LHQVSQYPARPSRKGEEDTKKKNSESSRRRDSKFRLALKKRKEKRTQALLDGDRRSALSKDERLSRKASWHQPREKNLIPRVTVKAGVAKDLESADLIGKTKKKLDKNHRLKKMGQTESRGCFRRTKKNDASLSDKMERITKEKGKAWRGPP